MSRLILSALVLGGRLLATTRFKREISNYEKKMASYMLGRILGTLVIYTSKGMCRHMPLAPAQPLPASGHRKLRRRATGGPRRV